MKRASFVSSFALALASATPAFAQSTPPAEGASDVPALPAPEGTAPRPRPGRAPAAATSEHEVVVTRSEPAPIASTQAVASSDRDVSERPPRYDLVRINAGLRVGYVPSRGFDTFSSNDVLPQFSIDGTYPLLTRGNLVLAAGIGWDVGARSDTIRGLASSLTAHHLYVPIEGRWHLSSGLYAFGKVSPGAAAAVASVQDPSSSNELSTTAWAFAADASLGASIALGPRPRTDKRTPRFWITPELGYAYTTNASLRPNPGRDEKDLLGSDESTNLRKLALSGFFWRASLGMTF